jgi:hypothetical protein
MSEHRFRVGDRVVVAPDVARAAHRGVVYRVTRLLPVNIVAEPVDGGRPIRVNPMHLRPAPDGDSAPPATAAVAGVPYEAPLDQGTLVTVAGPGWKQPPGELYVVLRDNGHGRASIVKLGGNGGRYWTGVSRRLLTVIDPGRVRLTPEQAT